jgi:hypothetical protein
MARATIPAISAGQRQQVDMADGEAEFAGRQLPSA